MITKRVAGLALAALTAAGGAVATSGAVANAADGAQGQVVSKTRLLTRAAPTRWSAAPGSFKPGQKIKLDCKITSENVDGNNLWYKIDPAAYDAYEWVSARYVKNLGASPRLCGGATSYHGTSLAALSVRSGPSTSTARVGSRSKGAALTIVCKVDNQSIGGNTKWYKLTNSGWVTARYVANNGKAPAYC